MTIKKENDTFTTVRFCDIEHSYDMDYADDYVAFHKNLSDLPIKNESLQIDMYIVVACMEGRLNVKVNDKPYSVAAQEVFICHPNAFITHCMMSPDFKGAALCLSKKAIQECFTEHRLWRNAVYLLDNPLVHLSDESCKMLVLYTQALEEKARQPEKRYKRHIVLSLVKAILCELMLSVTPPDTLSNTGAYSSPLQEGLFKQFLQLLSSTPVKPRSMQWYAEQLHVSAKYLSAVCKHESGKTAFEWIGEFVEKDVIYWLTRSTKSIKEISVLLDFPNPSFFGRYCRRRLGMSPSAYRTKIAASYDGGHESE